MSYDVGLVLCLVETLGQVQQRRLGVRVIGIHFPLCSHPAPAPCWEAPDSLFIPTLGILILSLKLQFPSV
jgi:hypothetical protein